MTTLDLHVPSGLGRRLFAVEDPLLVARYRTAMEHLGLRPTRLEAFRLDAAGWSPEVAGELGDAHYLGRGPSRPAFVVLSVDQLEAPLLQPNAGFGARPYLEWAAAHRRELADLTLREVVVGAFEHGVTRLRDLSQVGLVRRLRLAVETPCGRLAKAHELGALRAALLADGDAWRDEAHLDRMYGLAADTRGWAGLPAGMEPGRDVPVGPAYLAEFGGCHLLPGGEGAPAWLLVRPGTTAPVGRAAEVEVITASVETVNHFLVARGLVDPCPSTADLDPELVEDLRSWLLTQESVDIADLDAIERLRLVLEWQPRDLDLGDCSPRLRLRLRPIVTEDPALRWWVEHLRASIDPFLRGRFLRRRGEPLSGMVPLATNADLDREEVAA